jgi:DNA-binding ferritin-like protein
MLELVHILTALQIYCKDAHYSFYGIDFKPLHEWADEILDPLQGFIDEIKENYFISRGLVVPRGTEINASAADYVPTALGDNSQILANLLAIIAMAHNKLNGIEEKDAGLNDLLGRIDSHLLKHIALINMAITNTKREE